MREVSKVGSGIGSLLRRRRERVKLAGGGGRGMEGRRKRGKEEKG